MLRTTKKRLNDSIDWRTAILDIGSSGGEMVLVNSLSVIGDTLQLGDCVLQSAGCGSLVALLARPGDSL